MLLAYLLFALGFFLLVQGAHWLVEGSTSLARRFNISDLVIGLTVLAFGTSAPELFVNAVSSLRGASEIVFGNIVGSNIMNIGLILGASALVSPLPVRERAIFREIPIGIIGAVLVYLLAANGGEGVYTLSRLAGAGLLLGFVLFLRSIFGAHKREELIEDLEEVSERGLVMAGLLTVVGLAMLFLGGRLVVDQATFIAIRYGVSETLIGLTLVAIGTSLPELVTSVVASWRGKPDMAVGNVVGSNIFNLYLVLGFSAVLNPVRYAARDLVDVAVLAAMSLMLLSFSALDARRVIRRREAAALLAAYVFYTAFAIWRG